MKTSNRCKFILLVVLLLQTFFGSLSIAQAPPEEVQRITVADLKARLDAGDDVVVIDVRIKGAYDIGHIRNAISMPIGDIPTKHQELNKDRLIVFY